MGEKKDKKEKKAKGDSSDDDDKDGGGSDSGDSQKDDIDANELKSVVETLSDFVKSKGSGLSVTEFFDECKVMQATKQYDDKWRVYVALAALFPDGSLDGKSVSTRTKHLQKFKDFGNMSCPDFLWGFETYLVENPVSLKGYPMVLKALFDDDLLKEEELLEHYDSEDVDSKGFPDAKKQATPFLEWLRNAEEEGDSDEEEDDDDEDD